MAAKTKGKTPKRLAKQDRSKATIEAILGGATHVLIKEGYEGLNTNRIARTAGVSIGSIYQYFPDKESIVAELIDRQLQKVMSIFIATLGSLETSPLEQGIRTVIRALIEARKIDPKLHKVFEEQMPKVGKLRRLREFQSQAAEMVEEYLRSRKEKLRVKNLQLASFIAVQTVDGTLQVASNDRPDFNADSRLENELADLIYRYLV